MGCPSAYDCEDCFKHNTKIDPNWTSTLKHTFKFLPKTFCGETFPYDIVENENITIKTKKANAAVIKSEIVKDSEIEKRTPKNCHHLAFMTGELRTLYINLLPTDFRLGCGTEGNLPGVILVLYILICVI